MRNNPDGENSAILYNESIHSKFLDICSPLFENFEITTFFYIKIFDDGRRLYLCSNKKWLETYIKYKFYNDLFHIKTYMPENNIKHALWSGFERDKVFSAIHSLNVWHGFNIYETETDGSVIMYAFAAKPSSPNINNFYINNLGILHAFISHFKNVGGNIIDSSDVRKLIIPKEKYSQDLKIVESQNTKNFLQKINLEKLPFKTNNAEGFLSKQESICVHQISAGKSTKEIAKFLSLSPRTVDYYIDNIKKKVDCKKRTELISLFKENNFNTAEINKYML